MKSWKRMMCVLLSALLLASLLPMNVMAAEFRKQSEAAPSNRMREASESGLWADLAAAPEEEGATLRFLDRGGSAVFVPVAVLEPETGALIRTLSEEDYDPELQAFTVPRGVFDGGAVQFVAACYDYPRYYYAAQTTAYREEITLDARNCRSTALIFSSAGGDVVFSGGKWMIPLPGSSYDAARSIGNDGSAALLATPGEDYTVWAYSDALGYFIEKRITAAEEGVSFADAIAAAKPLSVSAVSELASNDRWSVGFGIPETPASFGDCAVLGPMSPEIGALRVTPGRYFMMVAVYDSDLLPTDTSAPPKYFETVHVLGEIDTASVSSIDFSPDRLEARLLTNAEMTVRKGGSAEAELRVLDDGGYPVLGWSVWNAAGGGSIFPGDDVSWKYWTAAAGGGEAFDCFGDAGDAAWTQRIGFALRDVPGSLPSDTPLTVAFTPVFGSAAGLLNYFPVPAAMELTVTAAGTFELLGDYDAASAAALHGGTQRELEQLDRGLFDVSALDAGDPILLGVETYDPETGGSSVDFISFPFDPGEVARSYAPSGEAHYPLNMTLNGEAYRAWGWLGVPVGDEILYYNGDTENGYPAGDYVFFFSDWTEAGMLLFGQALTLPGGSVQADSSGYRSVRLTAEEAELFPAPAVLGRPVRLPDTWNRGLDSQAELYLDPGSVDELLVGVKPWSQVDYYEHPEAYDPGYIHIFSLPETGEEFAFPYADLTELTVSSEKDSYSQGEPVTLDIGAFCGDSRMAGLLRPPVDEKLGIPFEDTRGGPGYLPLTVTLDNLSSGTSATLEAPDWRGLELGELENGSYRATVRFLLPENAAPDLVLTGHSAACSFEVGSTEITEISVSLTGPETASGNLRLAVRSVPGAVVTVSGTDPEGDSVTEMTVTAGEDGSGELSFPLYLDGVYTFRAKAAYEALEAESDAVRVRSSASVGTAPGIRGGPLYPGNSYGLCAGGWKTGAAAQEAMLLQAKGSPIRASLSLTLQPFSGSAALPGTYQKSEIRWYRSESETCAPADQLGEAVTADFSGYTDSGLLTAAQNLSVLLDAETPGDTYLTAEVTNFFDNGKGGSITNTLRDTVLLRTVESNDGLYTLAEGAAAGYDGFEEVLRLPEVTVLAPLAEEGAYVLGPAEIVLPGSLTEIGPEALRNFVTLTAVNIPAGVRQIGEGAFWNTAAGDTLTLRFDGMDADSPTFAENLVNYETADLCVLCYENSAAHLWALGERAEHPEEVRIVLRENSSALRVNVEDRYGHSLGAESGFFSSVSWIREEDGAVLARDATYCVPGEPVSGERRILCRLGFTSEARRSYAVPAEVTLAFEEIGTQTLALSPRETLTVTGRFDPEQLTEDFSALLTVAMPDLNVTEEITPDAEGRFTVPNIPRFPTVLRGENGEYCRDLLVRDVEMRPAQEGVVDLGLLRFDEDIALTVVSDAYYSGTLDGETVYRDVGPSRLLWDIYDPVSGERVLPKFTLVNAAGEVFEDVGASYSRSMEQALVDGRRVSLDEERLVLTLGPSAQDFFDPGERVRLFCQCPADGPYAMEEESVEFTLRAKKTADSVSSLGKPTFYARGCLKVYKGGSIRYFVFDSEDSKVWETSSGKSVQLKYLDPGQYTLVTFRQNTYFDTLDTPDQYDYFGLSEQYLKKIPFEILPGQQAEISDYIPDPLNVTGTLGLSIEADRSMRTPDNLIPIYIRYHYESPYGEETSRLDALNGQVRLGIRHEVSYANHNRLPAAQISGRYAVLTSGGQVDEEIFPVNRLDGLIIKQLELTVYEPEGILCLYVPAEGQTLYVSKLAGSGHSGDGIENSFTLPGARITDSAPDRVISHAGGSGTVAARYYFRAETSVSGDQYVRLYVDGEEVYRGKVNTGFSGENCIPYSLKAYGDGPVAHTIRAEVSDGEDNVWWTSPLYSTLVVPSEAPEPEELTIRMVNFNVDVMSWGMDGATLDLKGRHFPRMYYYFTPKYINTDNTLKGNIVFDYALKMKSPELVDGDVILQVYTKEKSPEILPVTLTWNEHSGRFEGSLVLEGGTLTPSELPYGYSLKYGSLSEIPTTVSWEHIGEQLEEYAASMAGFYPGDGEEADWFSEYTDMEELSFALSRTEALTGEQKEALRALAVAGNRLTDRLAESREGLAQQLASFLGEEALPEDMEALFASVSALTGGVLTAELLTGVTADGLRELGYRELRGGETPAYVLMDPESGRLSVIDPETGTHLFMGGGRDGLEAYRSPEAAEEFASLQGFFDEEIQSLSAEDAYQDANTALQSITAVVRAILSEFDDILRDTSALLDELDAGIGDYLKHSDEIDDLKEVEDAIEAIRKNNPKAFGVKTTRELAELYRQRDELKAILDPIRRVIDDLSLELLKETPNSVKCADLARKLNTLAGSKLGKAIPMLGTVYGFIMDLVDTFELKEKTDDKIGSLRREQEEADRTYQRYWASSLEPCIDGESAKAQTDAARALRDELGEQAEDAVDWCRWWFVSRVALTATDIIPVVMGFFPKLKKAELCVSVSLFTVAQLLGAMEAGVEVNQNNVDKLWDELNEACSQPFEKDPDCESPSYEQRDLQALYLEDWASLYGGIEAVRSRQELSEDEENILYWSDVQHEFLNADNAIITYTNRSPVAEVYLYRNGYPADVTWIVTDKEGRSREVHYQDFISQIMMYEDVFMTVRREIRDGEPGPWELLRIVRTESREDPVGPHMPPASPRQPESPQYPNPPKPALDPSGYVYEAVASNRVEGAVAEAYYREDGAEVFWDEAADYGQTNPYLTDREGHYEWMTPPGSWLVKVSKDGYAPASSAGDPAAVEGWLPVPPPQVNVNIPLISESAPRVESAAVAPDQARVVFSQYMDAAMLRESGLVTVTQGGEPMGVAVAFLDEEASPTDDTVTYGRVMKLTRSDGGRFTGDGIVITVAGSAENYAGKPLGGDYGSGPLTVAPILDRLEHSYPNRLVLEPGEKLAVAVQALDTEGNPMPGIPVAAEALQSGTLATAGSAVTDENGRALFPFEGISSGYGTVLFTAGNVSAELNTRVGSLRFGAPCKPTANRNDCDVLERGELLILTTATAGARIYYTTDGSCPCTETEEGGTHQLCTGPIPVTEDCFFRIAAWTEAGGYSERLNLRIRVKQPQGLSLEGTVTDGVLRYRIPGAAAPLRARLAAASYDAAGRMLELRLIPLSVGADGAEGTVTGLPAGGSYRLFLLEEDSWTPLAGAKTLRP